MTEVLQSVSGADPELCIEGCVNLGLKWLSPDLQIF